MSDREHTTSDDATVPGAAASPAGHTVGEDPEQPVAAEPGDDGSAPAGADADDAGHADAGDADAGDAADADAAGSDGSASAPEDVDAVLAEIDDPRSIDELRIELAEAESRRDEYLDDLRRARAEFENYRRRTSQEAGTARERGRADVAGALLEVLDDLDRTLEAADGSPDETLAKGVDLVADKLRRALGGQGLTRIDATGVPFDPEVHEAVQQVEAEEPSQHPLVHQVLRPGYRLGDRTLRAAMVVVAG